MYELAYKGKGLAINPLDLPYDVQCVLPEWHEEMVKEENKRREDDIRQAKAKAPPRRR